MIEKLEDPLTSAFPLVTIDRAMIDEPTALWHVYDDYAELAAFEGKTWREFAPELLYKHSMLLVFAGDDLWRATLSWLPLVPDPRAHAVQRATMNY